MPRGPGRNLLDYRVTRPFQKLLGGFNLVKRRQIHQLISSPAECSFRLVQKLPAATFDCAAAQQRRLNDAFRVSLHCVFKYIYCHIAFVIVLYHEITTRVKDGLSASLPDDAVREIFRFRDDAILSLDKREQRECLHFDLKVLRLLLAINPATKPATYSQIVDNETTHCVALRCENHAIN